jgi:hypothetical protein
MKKIIKRTLFIFFIMAFVVSFIQNFLWIFVTSGFPMHFSSIIFMGFFAVYIGAFYFLKAWMWDDK